MASMHTADTSFTVESCIHGYHVFQHIWVPIHGKVLSCSRERGNRSDPFTVALKKGEVIVAVLFCLQFILVKWWLISMQSKWR